MSPRSDRPTRPTGGLARRLQRAVHAARFTWLRVRTRGRVRAAAVPITAAGVKVLPHVDVRLGDRVALGRNMYVETNLTVGDDVLFSGDVAIVGNVHPIDGPGTVYASVERSDQHVVLDGDNLVGFGVIVIAPCHFERGAVAGAGAVVTGTLAEDTVYVGVPGRALRTRDRTV